MPPVCNCLQQLMMELLSDSCRVTPERAIEREREATRESERSRDESESASKRSCWAMATNIYPASVSYKKTFVLAAGHSQTKDLLAYVFHGKEEEAAW